MADEWTPLDDIGRSMATIKHHARRHVELLKRVEIARADALEKLNVFLAALATDPPDPSELTDEEAEEFAQALDVIHRVRDQLAPEVESDA